MTCEVPFYLEFMPFCPALPGSGGCVSALGAGWVGACPGSPIWAEARIRLSPPASCLPPPLPFLFLSYCYKEEGVPHPIWAPSPPDTAGLPRRGLFVSFSVSTSLCAYLHEGAIKCVCLCPLGLPGLRLPSSPFLPLALAGRGNVRPVGLPAEMGEVGARTGYRYTRSSQVTGTAYTVLGHARGPALA